MQATLNDEDVVYYGDTHCDTDDEGIINFLEETTLRCAVKFYKSDIIWFFWDHYWSIYNIIPSQKWNTTNTQTIGFWLYIIWFVSWLLLLDIIKLMFKNTTKLCTMRISSQLNKWYKSPHPGCNIFRVNDNITTDAVFSSTPSVDDGEALSQVLSGV